MGKTANCIKMLGILSSGKVYTRDELAKLLGTNVRNIIEYKRELENVTWAENEDEFYMGYRIMSYPGKDGGYQLDKSVNMPTIKLTPGEKIAFAEGIGYLDSDKNFVSKRAFRLAVSKINSAISNSYNEQSVTNIATQSFLMSSEDIFNRYSAIKDSINAHKSVMISYLSSDNVVRQRKVDFYDLFIYNDAWFGIGFCHLANDIRYFKTTRIQSIERLNESFTRPNKSFYDPSDYFDENGFKQGLDWSGNKDLEWIHIKLKLKGKPAMYVKEYRYGKNQVVTAVSKDETILECDMQYKYNTMRFVLGLGSDCEVLEPESLKEDILSTINDIKNIYKK